MGYKFLEHTADVKFVATGKTIEEAFTSVADALFETMTGGEKIKEKDDWKMIITEKDKFSLLYAFVEEFIFLLDTEGFIPSKIKSLKINGNSLRAVVLGDKTSNYVISTEVKSMTYSDMKIEEVDGQVEITGVFDV